jgi:hypothetical protein
MITKDILLEAISLTKNNYFKNVVKKNGKYTYSYLPEENQNKRDYNILRHAGTTYSILETYELMPDDELLKVAESAINYIIDKVKDFEINGVSVSVVVEKDTIKLGGNALAIIMLSKYTQITKNYKHIELMQSMAKYICETQDMTGEFVIQKQRYSTQDIYNFRSEYYPGEAILSLVRLYQLDGNNNWLNCAQLASNYLIKVRDRYANINTIIHDHWLLYALNELYNEQPQDMYIEHTLLIAKAIMKSQITGNTKNPDWNGAYSIPYIRLESTPTACRSEGLCAAYQLLIVKSYPKEILKIKKAIDLGIDFQLKNQLRPESASTYKNKKLCLGAFMRGFTRHDLRIDFTQHNISSLIAYYKILSNQD